MIPCALVSGKDMGLLHGRNFHALPDAKVVAVCDSEPALLAKAREAFGGAAGYASLDDLLDRCDAPLVLLIVNETRRIEPLCKILAAGRDVFTEKPLCGLEGQYRVRESDAAVAAPAVRAWRRSGRRFGINYNYRFFRHFRRLHDDAVEGRLGRIRMVRGRAHFNCWSHVIDQVLWTMGRPDWVSVAGDPKEPGGWQRMIRMAWPDGAIGQLDGSNLWGYDDHPLRLMLVGDKALGEARGLDGWYRRSRADAWPQVAEEAWEIEPDAPGNKGWREYEASFARMAAGVVGAIQAAAPLPADGGAAWDELVFEAAVHRSASRRGQRVRLADIEKAALAKGRA